MNKNPKRIAMIPIIIIAIPTYPVCLLMLKPMNAAEIPKNNRLSPTMTETKLAENIGNIIKINPTMTDNIPALFSTPIGFTSIYLINYLYN